MYIMASLHDITMVARLKEKPLISLYSVVWDSGKGYMARSHGLTEALMKKQVRLQMAMASGVRWVKFDSDRITQSCTTLVWLPSIIFSNTCRQQTSRLININYVNVMTPTSLRLWQPWKVVGWLKLTDMKPYIVNPMVSRPMMSRVPNGDSLRLDVLLGTNNGCKTENIYC